MSNNNCQNLEHFHEFLRGYTDDFTNNIYATKDCIYHNRLRCMIQNKVIVVVKGDKDSILGIMKKSDYVTKLDTMIGDSITKGTYVETIDNTLKELSRFQDFLYKTFIIMSAVKICNLIAINQHVFTEQLKPTNLKLYRTFQ